MTKKWRFLSFLLIPAALGQCGQITGLTLIDAASDRPIGAIHSGDAIDLSQTERGINIRAEVEGTVGSVRFGLNDNESYRVENVAPYALAGDNQGNYSEWVPSPGKYTVTATPYPQSGARGTPGSTLRVTFRVEGRPEQGQPSVAPGQYPDITCDEELEPVALPVGGRASIGGQQKQWHCIVLSFDGPDSSEAGSPNPFLHYRLEVTFLHDDMVLVAPGYYAGDGRGGPAGNQWQVRFNPPRTGIWTYLASFRAGFNVNVNFDPNAGRATACDGAMGRFDIVESDRDLPDFRAAGNGLLANRNHHYLTFGGSGQPWIKGGPDIPENFFGYEGFENTPNAHHAFTAHIQDWKPGDPDWGDGQGKGIIGAMNYIAEHGGNCFYFLPMNIGGDGKDTFPTIAPYEKTRYDNSKLIQWETVFQHAQSLGIFLHVQLAETESANENYHDNGTLGPERKLYYREIVARFGHHNGMEFNLGEENDYGTDRRIEFAQFIRAIDPYNHPIAVHTHSGKEWATYEPILERLAAGDDVAIDMTSFQGGRSRQSMAELMADMRLASVEAGHPWVCSYDEPQTIHNDKTDEDRGYPMARRYKMWPAYMGGGGGFEWYVQKDGGGHSLDHRIDDFSQMSLALEWAGHAREFLYNLPLLEVEPNPVPAEAARGVTYVLAKPGEVYALYNDTCGEDFRLDLTDTSGSFEVRWFDPRNGGPLRKSNVATVTGGDLRTLGRAPTDLDNDWACLVRRSME